MQNYKAVPMNAGTLVYVLVDGLMHTVLVALPDQYYNCRRPRSPYSQMFAVVCSLHMVQDLGKLLSAYGL